MDELIENTQKIMENDSLREEMGNNGFRYVNREHSINKIIPKYENAFETIIRKLK